MAFIKRSFVDDGRVSVAWISVMAVAFTRARFRTPGAHVAGDEYAGIRKGAQKAYDPEHWSE